MNMKMKKKSNLIILSLSFHNVFRKAEIETKRKIEEAERKRQEEEDLRAAVALQAQLEKEIAEDTKYRQQLEQERRDHELAIRLAQESNSQVDDGPLLSR